jgi:hypothetical protein
MAALRDLPAEFTALRSKSCALCMMTLEDLGRATVVEVGHHGRRVSQFWSCADLYLASRRPDHRRLTRPTAFRWHQLAKA